MAPPQVCRSCGEGVGPQARFCAACGTPVVVERGPAEYKQVTVLFADVVHSMDIAAAVGAERLREIMAELVERCVAVVKQYGGTVDKFTGDGVMAVFGAPVAYEDHAVRASLAALGIQGQAAALAPEFRRRDGIDLRLRIGLNSGEVIAGEITAAASLGYTAIGEHVGMAQRMESVAPPGGVMLSQAAARMVDDVAVLAPPEIVTIKGAAEPVRAYLLLAMNGRGQSQRRSTSPLVGREWEMGALAGILTRSVGGHGCVVTVVGPPGIGKSRLVAETVGIARDSGVDVFSTFCESHASDVPFRVVAALLRAAFGVADLGADAARQHLRERVTGADPEDLLLLDDLLGVADPALPVSDISPDARRRRITTLVNAAYLGRENPAVFVIEDAHWIDPISESMLAAFLSVVSRTSSLVLITYRPEYVGALSRLHGAQTIHLAPLDDSQTRDLICEMLGPDPSVRRLVSQIAERASGNPLFAESIVRDLADRRVLSGKRGNYVCRGDRADVTVPATLRSAIAARIDRLGPAAKRTLNAAAVIGIRFDEEALRAIADDTELSELLDAELIDQVAFAPKPEFGFRHPLIHRVAYESQLKADRAPLHRRLAGAIAASSGDESAALVAEHLASAGDLRDAYEWSMRAAQWLTTRDIVGACLSWERAWQLADELVRDDPGALDLQIAPRAAWCASAWRVRGDVPARFEELEDLCGRAGDKVSLAVGMAGLLASGPVLGRVRETAQLVGEHTALIESIADPTLTVGLAVGTISADVVTGRLRNVLRWSDIIIDLADGDPAMGNFVVASPLALAHATRSVARWALALPGWREDTERAVDLARGSDAMTRAGAMFFAFGCAIACGMTVLHDAVSEEINDAVAMAEAMGDDMAVMMARYTRGLVLLHGDPADRDGGLAELTQIGELIRGGRFYRSELPVVETFIGRELARRGDAVAGIGRIRPAVRELFDNGQHGWGVATAAALIEALLIRGTPADIAEAETMIDGLLTAPLELAPRCRELWLLKGRAEVARARGEQKRYRRFADGYRACAQSLEFDGHIAWAAAME